MLSEEHIIHTLQNAFPEKIGDDAAVLSLENNDAYVVTKDLLLEDIHFRTGYFSPEDIAHKALHVNLSDCAAMGASPLFLLCGIAIPMHLADYATALLSHLTLACKKEGILLIGGDTTRASDKLCLSITAIGKAPAKQIKYRHTAKPTDVICLAGELGHAHLGWLSLEKNNDETTAYHLPFLRPEAKVREGIWLGEQGAVHSLMDVSDGLWIDLKRLAKCSNLAAILSIEKIRPHHDFIKACEKLSVDPLQTTLIGGEDYSLLFTVKKEAIKQVKHAFFETFHYPLKEIGYIESGEGILLTENNKPIHLPLTPFTHFGEKP